MTKDVAKIVEGFDWNRVSWKDKEAKDSYKNEFYNAGETASHLLSPHPRGRKYWLVWGFDGPNK